MLTDEDIHLFREGTHCRLYHLNGWSAATHPLAASWDGSGICEGFVQRELRGQVAQDASPPAFCAAPARATASRAGRNAP